MSQWIGYLLCGLLMPAILFAAPPIPRSNAVPVWRQNNTENEQDPRWLLLQQAKRFKQDGRYAEAADVLERLLMFYPDYPEALLLYEQLLNWFESHNDSRTTSESRPDIQSNWQWFRKLAFYTGGGTNLNKAPLDDRITLTFPDGDIQLPLDKKQQPKPGFGIEGLVLINAAKPLNNNKAINLTAQLQQRSTDQTNFTDYTRFNASASLRQRLSGGDDAGLTLFTDILEYDNNERFYMFDLSADYHWQTEHICSPELGIDWQWQHQKDTSLYDMIYSAGAVAVQCNMGNQAYRLIVNAGREWAMNDRPGGDQWRFRGLLQQRWNLNGLIDGDFLNSTIDLTYQKDVNTYSPWLDQGNPRSMGRLSLNTQYRWPIYRSDSQWWGTVRISWEKQQSNIQLFEYEAFESWLGIEVMW
jgi:hypothetical protein